MNRTDLRNLERRLKREHNSYDLLFSKLVSVNTNDFDKLINYLKFKSNFNLIDNIYIPSDISGLSKYKPYYNLDFSSNIEKMLKLIKMYDSEICGYLEKKSKFNDCIFAGEYQNASKIIEDVENISVSFWSIQNRMLLSSFIKNDTEQRAETDKIVEGLKLNNWGIKRVLANQDLYDYNTSYFSYNTNVVNFISRFKDKALIERFFDFHLNMDYIYTTRDLPIVTGLSIMLPIIDVYETIVKLAQHQSFKNEIDFGDYLTDCKCFEIDYRIVNIIRYKELLYNKVLQFDKTSVKEKNYNLIIEDYTIGKYELCLKKIDLYERDFHSFFDLEMLKIKVYINLGKEYKHGVRAYQLIHDILIYKDDYRKNLDLLENELRFYKDNYAFYKIRYFLNRKYNSIISKRDLHLAVLNDEILSPIFSTVVDGFIENFRLITFKDYVCKTSVEFLKYMYSNKYNKDVLKDVTPLKLKLYANKKNGDSESLIESQIQLLDTIDNSNKYIREKLYRNIIQNSYINHRYNNLIEQFCKAYFENKDFIGRMCVPKLVDDIEVILYTSNIESILLPIFITLIGGNHNHVRVALTKVIKANDIKTYKSFISHSSQINERYKSYFLTNVCTLDVIKRELTLLRITDKPINLRMRFLHEVYNTLDFNKTIYFKELSQLTKQKRVEEKVKSINNSKINIDLKDIYIQNYRVLLESYRTFVTNYVSFPDIQIPILDDDSFNTNKSRKDNNTRNELKSKVLLSNFVRQIVVEVLTNHKYGLDSYLSSRIRHDYLTRQLTSPFSVENLLSKKVDDNKEEYTKNAFFENRIKAETERKIVIQLLEKFTLQVQSLVKEVKDSWVIIDFNDKRSNGLNFGVLVRSIKEQIFNDFNPAWSFEIVYDKIEKPIQSRISRELKILQDTILELLPNRFNEILNELDSLVCDNNKDGSDQVFEELHQRITNSRISLKQKITEFASVFNYTKPEYSDFQLSDVVDTCEKITTDLDYRFSSTKIDTDMQCNPFIKGKLFPHFTDVLNIMFSNAYEHSWIMRYHTLNISISLNEYVSEKEWYNISCNDSIYKEDNLVCLTFSNNLSEDRLENLRNSIDIEKSNFYSKKNDCQTDVTEGGTGIYKIDSIMNHNMPTKPHIFFDLVGDRYVIDIVFSITRMKVEEN